ncbi:hypothetical protein [Vibrio rumoiensis]|uniref:Uncharacterized protein n=1 Tax=Vibrio rumoiensis TaxID=76258 RepID=A0ABW7J089_9VIBR
MTKTNKLTIFIAMMFTANVSLASQSLHVAELQVKTNQVINPETKQTETTFKVDDYEVVLTKDDYQRAKNWNLSATDWAKYKYAIEFTPRGKWTPDLDPPIVLGNLAKTEAERIKYAKIMNELELDRRSREIAFQLSAISVLPKETPNQPEQQSRLKSVLPADKSILKSIFIDTETCDSSCNEFLLKESAGTSSRTKLNIIFTTESTSKQASILSSAGLNKEKISDKGITVTTNNEIAEKYKANNTYPYVIIQDDSGISRRDSGAKG